MKSFLVTPLERVGSLLDLGILLTLIYLVYESKISGQKFQESQVSLNAAVISMGVNTQQMIKENRKEMREMHADTRAFLKDIDTRTTAILERVEKNEGEEDLQ